MVNARTPDPIHTIRRVRTMARRTERVDSTNPRLVFAGGDTYPNEADMEAEWNYADTHEEDLYNEAIEARARKDAANEVDPLVSETSQDDIDVKELEQTLQIRRPQLALLEALMHVLNTHRTAAVNAGHLEDYQYNEQVILPVLKYTSDHTLQQLREFYERD